MNLCLPLLLFAFQASEDAAFTPFIDQLCSEINAGETECFESLFSSSFNILNESFDIQSICAAQPSESGTEARGGIVLNPESGLVSTKIEE